MPETGFVLALDNKYLASLSVSTYSSSAAGFQAVGAVAVAGAGAGAKG